MNRYEQWEWLKLKARELKVDADEDPLHRSYRIGRKRYDNVIDASVALIVAFKKVGIKIPEEVLDRPTDLYMGER